MTTRSTLLATALAALAIGAGTEREARADIRVHVGGHAHVRVGGGGFRTPRVHWRPRWNYARPAYRVQVRGAIWLGGGYYYNRPYAAPPPPAYCDCGPSTVPSYYPVAPAPVTYAAAVARPELPRFGVGLFAGGVDVGGEHYGDDFGLLARLRLSRGLLIEGDIGKSELADGARVDRRLGAGLVWELGAYNRWAPYFVGSLGVMQTEVGGGDNNWETTQSYGELGVGLRFAVTPSFHLAVDIRGGQRQQIEEDGTRASVGVAREVTPAKGDGEEYTRARLSAILYF